MSNAVTVTPISGGARFAVRVQPRASRNETAGVYGTALKIRLSAPPVDGAANDALISFLAELLAVPRRSIRIVSGHSSRQKVVEVDGVAPEQIHEVISNDIQGR